MNVAFLGLGTMGSPMARRLIEADHRVTGFDVDHEALARHRAHGGEAAGSAAEAARTAEVVITMLPEARHVRAALLGSGGASDGLEPGALVVDMSTVHPLDSDAIRTDLAARGVAMVDAPVGRTSKHARAGTLLVLAGAEPRDLERVRPLFDRLGEATIDCGGPGRGIRMKIVNNFMSTALNALSAEALALAEAAGLDVGLTIEVLSGTPAGQGHFRTTYPNKALAGDLAPDFMLKLAQKDLALAIDLATRLGAQSRLGPAALERYAEAVARERGEEDWTALYPAVRQAAGLDTL